MSMFQKYMVLETVLLESMKLLYQDIRSQVLCSVKSHFPRVMLS